MPMVKAGQTRQIAEHVYLIPDGGVPLVPNIGIIVGSESILVIDTGMGPANGETVLSEVRKLSNLPIKYLTSTHFHPEHLFGAQVFPGETILVIPEAQHRDLVNKGEKYREWFVELFGDDVRALLEPVRIVAPDVTFDDRAYFNLGGVPVELHYFGRAAHTGGDLVVFLPGQKIAFVGDLVPNGFFPIVPDADSSVSGWLETLEDVKALGATTLVPGHGNTGNEVQIAAIRSYLEAVQKRASALRAEGMPLTNAQEAISREMIAAHPDWKEPHWINNAVERVYSESAAAESSARGRLFQFPVFWFSTLPFFAGSCFANQPMMVSLAEIRRLGREVMSCGASGTRTSAVSIFRSLSAP